MLSYVPQCQYTGKLMYENSNTSLGYPYNSMIFNDLWDFWWVLTRKENTIHICMNKYISFRLLLKRKLLATYIYMYGIWQKSPWILFNFISSTQYFGTQLNCERLWGTLLSPWYISGLWREKKVYQARISNSIPPNTEPDVASITLAGYWCIVW